ncbi:hypothetical protein TNCV_730941 [Trichonephila clavipes]|nr:hypothetical protein TNCV_730941 [Trichonephila clavipes]
MSAGQDKDTPSVGMRVIASRWRTRGRSIVGIRRDGQTHHWSTTTAKSPGYRSVTRANERGRESDPWNLKGSARKLTGTVDLLLVRSEVLCFSKTLG